jgi:hypothetical protein
MGVAHREPECDVWVHIPRNVGAADVEGCVLKETGSYREQRRKIFGYAYPKKAETPGQQVLTIG